MQYKASKSNAAAKVITENTLDGNFFSCLFFLLEAEAVAFFLGGDFFADDFLEFDVVLDLAISLLPFEIYKSYKFIKSVVKTAEMIDNACLYGSLSVKNRPEI